MVCQIFFGIETTEGYNLWDNDTVVEIGRRSIWGCLE
jgi:hypothetical protein